MCVCLTIRNPIVLSQTIARKLVPYLYSVSQNKSVDVHNTLMVKLKVKIEKNRKLIHIIVV